MQNGYKIFLGTLLLFTIVTFATASLDYDADGADQYGFPLDFYSKVTGYNIETNQGGTSINFDGLALVGDILFALIMSWILVILFNKFILAKKVNQ